ncbi:hypothetical protein BS50DRAFT_480850 [Corynespora cassiicola Philippines]|uniref:Uncharacterized protein n=1 Tax=Corynespora cassiicola Philippines TaxID=1448308 RepID=A0A2T2P8A6_CORCC|nr:hypothetical protein BS50DRAFT_480850 [Corynespora cassiicola Philippines]
MRSFIFITFIAFLVLAAAIPITPSARELQKRAEQIRLEGISEHEIAERLSLPETETESAPQSFYTHFTSKLHGLFRRPSKSEGEDESGDIPPGSLDSPTMLPPAAAPQSFTECMAQKLKSILHGEDTERYGYEGKELELRRPTGMRHWGY